MPTVLHSGPYRFFFYSSDEPEPVHVHVHRERMRAKVWLLPVRIDWSKGFRPAELRRIVHLVAANEALLVRRWNEYFES